MIFVDLEPCNYPYFDLDVEPYTSHSVGLEPNVGPSTILEPCICPSVLLGQCPCFSVDLKPRTCPTTMPWWVLDHIHHPYWSVQLPVKLPLVWIGSMHMCQCCFLTKWPNRAWYWSWTILLARSNLNLKPNAFPSVNFGCCKHSSIFGHIPVQSKLFKTHVFHFV